jgi:hypothetical protein
MIDPAAIAELEADLKDASVRLQGAFKHVRYLAMNGKPGLRSARHAVISARSASMRAELALMRAKRGMG